MKLWGPIVKKQLAIAKEKTLSGHIATVYLPPIEVIASYNQFLINHKQAPILQQVTKILLHPDFFKYNNFYNLNLNLFTGKNRKICFVQAVNSQLNEIKARKRLNIPAYTLSPDCIKQYNAILKTQSCPGCQNYPPEK